MVQGLNLGEHQLLLAVLLILHHLFPHIVFCLLSNFHRAVELYRL